MMERSSRFIALSGLSDVCAGLTAAAGASTAGWYFNRNMQGAENSILTGGHVHLNDAVFLLVLAAAIVFLAIGSAAFIAIRGAINESLPFWNTAAQLTRIQRILPLGTGAIFCMIVFSNGIYRLLDPVTLTVYGLESYHGSQFTLMEVRHHGVSEIILGLTAWPCRVMAPSSGHVDWVCCKSCAAQLYISVTRND